MAKKKTSIMIDEDTWKAFIVYTVQRTGSARKIGEQVEQALKNHMINRRDYHMYDDSLVCMVGPSYVPRVLNNKAKEGYATAIIRMWK